MSPKTKTIITSLVFLCIVGMLCAQSAIAETARQKRITELERSIGGTVVGDASGDRLEGEDAQKVIMTYTAMTVAGIVVVVVAYLVFSRISARRHEEAVDLQYLTENLMTPGAVRDHLGRVAVARTPISVWIDDHFIRFVSRLEDISGGRTTIALQPLSPAAGNGMMRGAKQIRMEYLHQKVPYYFATTVTGERADRGSFMHEVGMPEQILFTQRRDHYRVEPHLSAALLAEVSDREIGELSITDIGIGGFAIATSARFKPGEEVPGMKLRGGGLLPASVTAKCAYEVSLPESSSRFRYRYGFEIIRFTESAEKRISLYLARLQMADLAKRREMEG